MRYITLASLAVGVVIGISGCVTTESKSDSYQKWSDYFACKARRFREKEAERRAAKEERDRCNQCCCEQERAKGEFTDTTQTEVRFLLENDISVVDYGLDYAAIEKMAARQKKFDEEYDRARKAYEEMEDERYRRHLEQERAQVRSMTEAPATCDATGCGCVRVTPSCAYPTPKEFVHMPAPKRRAVGLDEIPIVIRAQAKFDVGPFAMQRARVKQKYQPGKQPCCPQCGMAGCGERCDACGYERSGAVGADVPPAPAAGDDEFTSAGYFEEPQTDEVSEVGMFQFDGGS